MSNPPGQVPIDDETSRSKINEFGALTPAELASISKQESLGVSSWCNTLTLTEMAWLDCLLVSTVWDPDDQYAGRDLAFVVYVF